MTVRQLQFVKAQGLGNDFIIVDCLAEDPLAGLDLAAIAEKLCDRNFGIGADGLILILPSNTADYRMRIINSDGSEPEMCGNGIRCFARYLVDTGLGMTPMTVETLAGIMTINVVFDGARASGFTVDMGAPRLSAAEIPVVGSADKVVAEPLVVDGETYEMTCVSMGNPHCIIYVDDVEAVPLTEIGPKIETHAAFPKKTNVEFVQVISPSEIRVRVWERGAGVTLACGTGACASVVASVLNGKIEREATVHLPGGDLQIAWGEDNNVYMTGPAEVVFKGTINI